MATASFRCHGELNDFLAPERRRAELTVTLARAASAKHMIEALGVPHTEVGAILVNGASVGFAPVVSRSKKARCSGIIAAFARGRACKVKLGEASGGFS